MGRSADLPIPLWGFVNGLTAPRAVLFTYYYEYIYTINLNYWVIQCIIYSIF